jgi:polyisoprenyl-phosphate glycosyltransferase
MTDSQTLLSVVVPLYDEELCLHDFHSDLSATLQKLGGEYEILYVDDGSADGTWSLLCQLAEKDSRIRAIQLSRNFGHQCALTAGLDFACGGIVVQMDGDGQHPPSLIPLMIESWKMGFDVVLTKRRDTEGIGIFKRSTSSAFYRLLNRLSATAIEPSSSDFRLMTRASVDALNSMRESHRFVRGMVSWLGFRQCILEYKAGARLAGRSKYSFAKMFRFASEAIFSFSTKPLKLCIFMGSVLFLLAFLEALHVGWVYWTGGYSKFSSGWPSLMFFILLLGGLQLMTLGLLGHYVGYIFQEVKRRPIYVVREMAGSQNRGRARLTE